MKITMEFDTDTDPHEYATHRDAAKAWGALCDFAVWMRNYTKAGDGIEADMIKEAFWDICNDNRIDPLDGPTP